MTTHELLILRHAKSAWPPDVPDHERPLGKRGRRDAPRAGAWLDRTGRAPDHVLCSTARRTRDTWTLAAAHLRDSPSITFDDRVYGADLATLLHVIADTPEEIARLLVVGHDPGVQDLTLHLAGNVHDDTLDRVRTKFPTCAIAVLTGTGPWPRLTAGSARLTEFITPAAWHHNTVTTRRPDR